jgi:hypothetical protein
MNLLTSFKNRSSIGIANAVLLLFLGGIICGCSSKPDYLLEEEKYVKMIAEFQLNKAYLQVTKDSLGYIQMKDSIFKHYDVSEANFDSSHAFFEKDIESQVLRYQKAQYYLIYFENGPMNVLKSVKGLDSLGISPSAPLE